MDEWTEGEEMDGWMGGWGDEWMEGGMVVWESGHVLTCRGLLAVLRALYWAWQEQLRPASSSLVWPQRWWPLDYIPESRVHTERFMILKHTVPPSEYV